MVKRKIKIGRFWLTKDVLDSLYYIVELQESTGKLRPGIYRIHGNGYVVNFKIVYKYSVILEDLYYEER